MLHYVYSSHIYKKLERTQMFINRGMNRENVVHIHIFTATKYDDFTKFLSKWIDLENIILSEVTQAQMNTHGMHSLISGY